MNYTIPKSRQEAIEIYIKIIFNYNHGITTTMQTKYDMFIGALCSCSNDEWIKFNNFNDLRCINCINIFNFKLCGLNCVENRNEIFNKRWNE